MKTVKPVILYAASGMAILTGALVLSVLPLPKDHAVVVLVLVLMIQVCSLLAGVGPGVLSAVLGALAYNFLFIDPVGTFAISRKEDMAAFIVFTISGLVVGWLSSLANHHRREIEWGKDQVDRLYALSRELLSSKGERLDLDGMADAIVRIFNLEYCGIHVPIGKNGWKSVSLSSAYPRGLTPPEHDHSKADLLTEILREQNRQVEYRILKSAKGLVGVMAVRGGHLSEETVSALSGLVGLSLQRWIPHRRSRLKAAK